jgi:hypothetical protein
MQSFSERVCLSLVILSSGGNSSGGGVDDNAPSQLARRASHH